MEVFFLLVLFSAIDFAFVSLSTLFSLTSSERFDPVDLHGDAAVDSGLVSRRAADPPTDDPLLDVVSTRGPTHQRSTAVALQHSPLRRCVRVNG